MILLDMRTIVFCSVGTDIVCLLVILLLWHQSRKRFQGTGLWVFDFFFQLAGVFLIILRGSILNLMSIVLSNTLVIGGAILGYMGLRRFVGKKASQFHNYILLAAFACVHAYFTFVQPNVAARNLNLSVGLLIICFQCMWFLVYTVEPGVRPLTLGVGMVFGGYCLVSIVRIVRFFIGSPQANDYFHFSAFESLILISYQILFILLTYTLALMVNKRLFLEVTTQEEKFAKAFHSSPYTIMLTRLSDGEIIEVNERFLNMTGYQYVETIGKTSVDLHFWEKEEDRVAVVNELSKSGKVQGREFQFRKKSGEVIIGLFSAEIIRIHNQEFILSSISDITERKRAEEALRESEERYKSILENIQDGYFENDLTGNLTFVNDALCRDFGYSREELIGMNYRQYTDEKTATDLFRHYNRLYRTGEPVKLLEIERIGKDGKRSFAEVSTSVIRDSEGKPIGFRGTSRDITERKRAEERIARLTKLYVVLSRVNETIVRTYDEEALLEAVCRILAEEGGFPLVWVGLLKERQIEPTASHGSAADYLKEIKVEVDGALGMGPTGTCVREDRPVMNDDFEINPSTAPWREPALRYGFRASSAFPLHRQGRVIGALTLYAPNPGAFDTDQINLLEALCADISYALDAMRQEKLRSEAEDSLRQRTLELQQLTETLEMRVKERTEELQTINEQLRVENEERLRVEVDLRESENRLRELSSALLSAQERERKLIAGEIHDSLGASLAATKFKVEAALKEMGKGNPQTKAALQSVVPIIQGTIEETRRIQMSLRPSMLDDLGILATINWFCRQFGSTYSHIQIRQEINIEESEVPDFLKTVIYRLLQETMNNIAKHSKANSVNLLLQKTNAVIELGIQDNGQGFDLEEASSRKGSAKGLGLDSMRERAELSGGFLSIESSKGAGTIIRAKWPLNS